MLAEGPGRDLFAPGPFLIYGPTAASRPSFPIVNSSRVLLATVLDTIVILHN